MTSRFISIIIRCSLKTLENFVNAKAIKGEVKEKKKQGKQKANRGRLKRNPMVRPTRAMKLNKEKNVIYDVRESEYAKMFWL